MGRNPVGQVHRDTASLGYSGSCGTHAVILDDQFEGAPLCSVGEGEDAMALLEVLAEAKALS